MKHWRLLPLILSAVGLSFGSTLFSSHPAEVQAMSDDYYASINWSQSGATLKTALCNLIHSHTNVGYSGLWNVYKTSDVRSDGCIWDMYSDNTNYAPGGSAQGASYKQEGDSYNREHTIPQSVFNEASPMKADAFHVYPTDGYVNNRRGTYPHADVGSVTWASHNNFVKIGTSSDAGISGTVCEVADEYKGDFARTYFYFVTCYQNEMKSRNWGSYAPFNYSSALGLNDAYLAVYLKWSAQDPVSQKEIDRNNAVYSFQKNRNPFIDHPEAVEKIWGNNTGGDSSSSSSSSSNSSSSSSSSSSEVATLEAIHVDGSWKIPFGGKPSGEIKVYADYTDGTSKDITALVTLPMPNNKVLGSQTLTVTYQGKTANFLANVTNVGADPGKVAVTKEVTIQPHTEGGKVTYTASDDSWSGSNSSSGINTSSTGDFVNLGSSKNAGSITLTSSETQVIRQVKLHVASYNSETPTVTCEVGDVSQSHVMEDSLTEMVFDFPETVEGNVITISNDGGKKRIQIQSITIVCQEGSGPAFTAEEQARAWADYFLTQTTSYDQETWIHCGDEYLAMTKESIDYYQAHQDDGTLQSAQTRYQTLLQQNAAWDFQGDGTRPEPEEPSSSSLPSSSDSSEVVSSFSNSSSSVNNISNNGFQVWPILVAVGIVVLLGVAGFLVWFFHHKSNH